MLLQSYFMELKARSERIKLFFLCNLLASQNETQKCLQEYKNNSLKGKIYSVKHPIKYYDAKKYIYKLRILRHFITEIGVVSKHVKDVLIHQSLGKSKLKSQQSDYIPIKMSKFKTIIHNKFWQEYGATGTLIYYYLKIVLALLKTGGLL